MRALEAFTRKNLTTILLLFLAGGFAVTLVELFLLNHMDGVQNVAVIASILGLLAVVAGLFVKGGLRTGVIVVLLLLSLSGLIGTFQHLEATGGGEASAPALVASRADTGFTAIASRAGVDVQRPAAQEEEEAGEGGEAGEAGESEGGPPLLAPLSITGLALMAVVVLLGAPAREEQA
ncbi:MAG: hypothetical protein H3C34_14460 [Caldilineaceae bacterium]|nr:hypothetical protein [Caldilineaceae bacterium]